MIGKPHSVYCQKQVALRTPYYADQTDRVDRFGSVVKNMRKTGSLLLVNRFKLAATFCADAS